MASIKLIYSNLMYAYDKASMATEQYNDRVKYLTDLETSRARSMVITESQIKERIRIAKDEDKKLASLFSRYKFWKSETDRHLAALQGIEIYLNFLGNQVSDEVP